MAIFKKTQMQGNFILSNGTQVLFDKQGYFETDKEEIISQLAPIYEEVEKREEPVAEQEKPKAQAGSVGTTSSAQLAAMVKSKA